MIVRTSLTLACLASAVVPASCGKPAEAVATPAAAQTVSVRTAVAEARAVRRTRTYPGNTASVSSVAISARVAGFLDKQVAPDGASVKAGDVLCTIDKRPFEVALEQARASLAQAQASVDQAAAALLQAQAQVPGARAARDLAQRDVDRNRPLVPSGALSKQAFDQYESKLEQAQSTLAVAEAAVGAATAQRAAAAASVKAAQAQVDAAQLNLSYCTITSPVDGMIGVCAVSEGQMVGPGYTVVLNHAMSLDPMYVEFSPSATEWPAIRAQLEKGPVAAEIQYGGVSTIVAKGTVTFSDNTVDPSTSTILLRATFPNPDGAFRPGTYSNVQVDLGEIPNVVMIPMQSLVARETDFFVWRVKQDDTVENVRIETTVRDGEMVGVSAGLSAGDRVVSAGMQKLTAGAKVEEAAAPEAK
ncbi:MAG: efflux RND transporter periplasmic adaptor subunit [Planctomycetaceae bacterium]|nr:efflux RND transporter periplasmic adaptor subunit [Planctomycetaceae bacterium]